MIDTYFHWLNELIKQFAITHISQVTFEKRSQSIGFIRGELRFLDSSCLHFREYVNVERGVDRYMYVYHYQRADGSLIFRYDNTPHFPGLSNFPHHKHETQEVQVIGVEPPDLAGVLAEIQGLLATTL